MARYLLEQLVKIPSVTGQEARLAAFCEDYLQSCGFHTHRQYVTATRFNIVAEKGSGKWSLLLYSHLDTVAPSPGWVHSPYQMVQDGDYLYGLGISDMKAEGDMVTLKLASGNADLPYLMADYHLMMQPGGGRHPWGLASSNCPPSRRSTLSARAP